MPHLANYFPPKTNSSIIALLVKCGKKNCVQYNYNVKLHHLAIVTKREYCLLIFGNLTAKGSVVPLLRDHPVVHTKVVFKEGWSFIRGRKQCKPKHVSSGILVLNVRWYLIRVVSQEGDLYYKT